MRESFATALPGAASTRPKSATARPRASASSR